MLQVKADDAAGWAAITLLSVICNRQPEKLLEATQRLTQNYTDKEIRAIWRKIQPLLIEADIAWLQSTLNQSIELQTAS
jgi:hypothetical protein